MQEMITPGDKFNNSQNMVIKKLMRRRLQLHKEDPEQVMCP